MNVTSTPILHYSKTSGFDFIYLTCSVHGLESLSFEKWHFSPLTIIKYVKTDLHIKQTYGAIDLYLTKYTNNKRKFLLWP